MSLPFAAASQSTLACVSNAGITGAVILAQGSGLTYTSNYSGGSFAATGASVACSGTIETQ